MRLTRDVQHARGHGRYEPGQPVTHRKARRHLGSQRRFAPASARIGGRIGVFHPKTGAVTEAQLRAFAELAPPPPEPAALGMAWSSRQHGAVYDVPALLARRLSGFRTREKSGAPSMTSTAASAPMITLTGPPSCSSPVVPSRTAACTIAASTSGGRTSRSTSGCDDILREQHPLPSGLTTAPRALRRVRGRRLQRALAAIQLVTVPAPRRKQRRDQRQAGTGDPLSPRLSLDDFVAHLEVHKYLYRPTGKLWPRAGVNAAVPPVCDGESTQKGSPCGSPASDWLDEHQAGAPGHLVARRPGNHRGSAPEPGRVDRAVGLSGLQPVPTTDDYAGRPGPGRPMGRSRAAALPRARGPHHHVVRAPGPASVREGQPRALAGWRARHRQGHHPQAGAGGCWPLELRGRLADAGHGPIQWIPEVGDSAGP